MILVDANVPMYLVGSPHRHKDDVLAILDRLVPERRRFVTDAEAFQEILHRYVFIRRYDAIQPAFDALRSIAEDVPPVTEDDVIAAKGLVLRRHGIDTIFSFDEGFDGIPGLQRIAG